MNHNRYWHGGARQRFAQDKKREKGIYSKRSDKPFFENVRRTKSLFSGGGSSTLSDRNSSSFSNGLSIDLRSLTEDSRNFEDPGCENSVSADQFSEEKFDSKAFWDGQNSLEEEEKENEGDDVYEELNEEPLIINRKKKEEKPCNFFDFEEKNLKRKLEDSMKNTHSSIKKNKREEREESPWRLEEKERGQIQIESNEETISPVPQEIRFLDEGIDKTRQVYANLKDLNGKNEDPLKELRKKRRKVIPNVPLFFDSEICDSIEEKAQMREKMEEIPKEKVVKRRPVAKPKEIESHSKDWFMDLNQVETTDSSG
eukprot:TRINITY_DN99_c0_g1_i1.p2 TRINITY_DN99_c0_g1~~TRINITY_DN99_c0_g1_i1.p2  ORF type:complete len:313 (-),score=127.02 TRINITY_DN99_c0_g1_i1:1405-2343(-)